jgi:hypothetical protein
MISLSRTPPLLIAVSPINASTKEAIGSVDFALWKGYFCPVIFYGAIPVGNTPGVFALRMVGLLRGTTEFLSRKGRQEYQE